MPTKNQDSDNDDSLGLLTIKVDAKNRLLLLTGEVTVECISELIGTAMVYNSRSSEPIFLYIDSWGGSVEAAIKFVDFCRLSQAPIIGIVYGMRFSSALVILMGCHVRLGTKHSRFIAHLGNSKITVPTLYVREKLAEHQNYVKNLWQLLSELFVERTGQDLRTIKKLLLYGEITEKVFFAKEAKKFGFIDKVLNERLGDHNYKIQLELEKE